MKVRILKRAEALHQPRQLNEISRPDMVRHVETLPQCEAQRSSRYCGSYEANHPDKTCTLAARYEIDGLNLCGRHAGEIALSFLLRGDDDG